MTTTNFPRPDVPSSNHAHTPEEIGDTLTLAFPQGMPAATRAKIHEKQAGAPACPSWCSMVGEHPSEAATPGQSFYLHVSVNLCGEDGPFPLAGYTVEAQICQAFDGEPMGEDGVFVRLEDARRELLSTADALILGMAVAKASEMVEGAL